MKKNMFAAKAGLVAVALMLTTGVSLADSAVVEPVSLTNPLLYAEIGGGGYYRNMRDDSVIGAQNKITEWKHGRMGWHAGFDMGYQFWKNIAAEFGFFWMQDQKMTFREAKTYGGVSFANGATIFEKSWALYLAGRATFEVGLDWDLYGKLGVAYAHNRFEYHPINTADLRASGSLWSPYLGVGLNYHLSKHWLLGMDYALIIGNSSNVDPYYSNRLTGSDVHVPSMQRLTINVGYELQI